MLTLCEAGRQADIQLAVGEKSSVTNTTSHLADTAAAAAAAAAAAGEHCGRMDADIIVVRRASVVPTLACLVGPVQQESSAALGTSIYARQG
jgi:hypothetical protein